MLRRSVAFKQIRFQSTKPNEFNHSLNASTTDNIYHDFRRSSNYFSENRKDDSANDTIPEIAFIENKLKQIKSRPIDFNYYLRNLRKIEKSGNFLPFKFGDNQIHSGNENVPVLKEILKRFHNVSYSFGYGSKIFSQGSNQDISNSQIDLIIGVKDTTQWHKQNIIENSSDYSFLKFFGSSIINKVGNLGAGIYFNPFVDIKINNEIPIELKYGVTSTASIMDDLTNWSTLYISGRLHKPVAIIENNPEIMFLNQYNLSNAVKLSLLLLNKEIITDYELFLTIAKLSYMGDPRLKVKGENPNKVNNIVDNQYDLFKDLYNPILNNYHNDLIHSISDNKFKINLSKESIAKILIELPYNFRYKLFKIFEDTYANEIKNDELIQNILMNPKFDSSCTDLNISYNELIECKNFLNEVPKSDWEYLPVSVKINNSKFLNKLSNDMYNNPKILQSALSKTIETIVGESALTQSLKGILTAGLISSWKYAIAKRRKYLAATNKK